MHNNNEDDMITSKTIFLFIFASSLYYNILLFKNINLYVQAKNCEQCMEDFPCPSTNKFSSDGISHHKRTVENSKRIKEIGIEAWIAEQKRKGQYVFCP